MVGLIFGVASERLFWAALGGLHRVDVRLAAFMESRYIPAAGKALLKSKLLAFIRASMSYRTIPHRRHRQMRGSCCRATRPLHRSGAGDRR